MDQGSTGWDAVVDFDSAPSSPDLGTPSNAEDEEIFLKAYEAYRREEMVKNEVVGWAYIARYVGGALQGSRVAIPFDRTSASIVPTPSPPASPADDVYRLEIGNDAPPVHIRLDLVKKDGANSGEGGDMIKLQNLDRDRLYADGQPIDSSLTSILAGTTFISCMPGDPASLATGDMDYIVIEYPKQKGRPAYRPELSSRYRPYEYLGSGSTAEVYAATKWGETKSFALKCARVNKGHEAIVKEAECLEQLHGDNFHFNIVRPFELHNSMDETFLAMEQGEGSLQDLCDEGTQPSSEEYIKRIAWQVLSALRHAANKNRAHLDVKPGNILFKDATRKDIFLIDWEDSVDLTDNPDGPLPFAGTPELMDPALAYMTGRRSDARMADVWSLGMLILFLFGIDPRHTFGKGEAYPRAAYKAWWDPIQVQIDEHGLSDDAKQVIVATLKRRPEHRPTMNDLFDNYAWFKVDIETREATADETSTPMEEEPVNPNSRETTAPADLTSPSSDSLPSVGSTATSVPKLIRTSATPEPEQYEAYRMDDTEDDVFHDATDKLVEPIAYLEVPSHKVRSVIGEKRKHEEETIGAAKRARFAMPESWSGFFHRLRRLIQL